MEWFFWIFVGVAGVGAGFMVLGIIGDLFGL